MKICQTLLHPPSGHSLSLSLSLANAVHPEGTPGSCRGWTPAVDHLYVFLGVGWGMTIEGPLPDFNLVVYVFN